MLSEESSSQHTHREACLLFFRCGESPRRCRAYPWPFHGKRPALSTLVSVKGRGESSFGGDRPEHSDIPPIRPVHSAARSKDCFSRRRGCAKIRAHLPLGSLVGGHASVAHRHSYTIGPFVWLSTQWGSLSVSTTYFFPVIETSRLFLVSIRVLQLVCLSAFLWFGLL